MMIILLPFTASSRTRTKVSQLVFFSHKLKEDECSNGSDHSTKCTLVPQSNCFIFFVFSSLFVPSWPLSVSSFRLSLPPLQLYVLIFLAP